MSMQNLGIQKAYCTFLVYVWFHFYVFVETDE